MKCVSPVLLVVVTIGCKFSVVSTTSTTTVVVKTGFVVTVTMFVDFSDAIRSP